ncbi:acyl-CoA reductase [Echinicola pacifica]|uniref:Acyl-CoA reductase n=1 Tax=Echinicola pacifica TaxID=346377 RepID=A0A918PX58_9BACT|nr:acyl-CoA reductase [Echinicola pacifica]GGZ25885.1 acyl-CoA reductase [Echinicola pacifica]
MTAKQRIEAFIALGNKIEACSDQELDDLFRRAENNNSWFTPEQVNMAIKGIRELLLEKPLLQWANRYSLPDGFRGLKIGVLMAGNIPGVGFHDLMMVLLAGYQAHVKLSSNDQVVIKWLVAQLRELAPELADRVFFEEMLKAKDAYIATGSDNSARYFEYYFGKYPSIIRKNRTSVAVLNGQETSEDYLALAGDVFQYFGLGCRNVSKVYLKSEQQIKDFYDAIEAYQLITSQHKYLNNYDYNKSIYLVNGEPHLDNGFLLTKNSSDLVSPVAVLYYEIYEEAEQLKALLSEQESKIQCVVSKDAWFEGSLAFGEAQCPGVEDYADHVDTMAFLLGLK